MGGENIKKYYLMTKNANGNLYLYIRGNYCTPAPEWTDAAEGIVTELERVEQWKDKEGKKHVTVQGRMVETEEMDWTAQDILKIIDVYPFEFCTLLEKYSDMGRAFYANIKGEGLCEVSVSVDQRNSCDHERKKAMRYEVIQRVIKDYTRTGNRELKESIIRNFAEIKLDSAESVTVYGSAIFYVFYPGAYRDFCKQFVVDAEGKLINVSFDSVDKMKMLNGRYYFRTEKILEEMDELGIAVGADSGDIVEGVSEEERKYLTTKKLPNGAILVMFKAEKFSYALLENENLVSKVCTGLGKWTNRLGEENPYWGWID